MIWAVPVMLSLAIMKGLFAVNGVPDVAGRYKLDRWWKS